MRFQSFFILMTIQPSFFVVPTLQALRCSVGVFALSVVDEHFQAQAVASPQATDIAFTVFSWQALSNRPCSLP